MVNKDSIETEMKFIRYMNAGVQAFKEMSEDTSKNFYNCVKNKVPLIENIPGSNVLLSKIIIGIANLRRMLIYSIRERKNLIKFSDIEKHDDYIKLKNELFENDENFTNADCNRVLEQICNRIAHGNISQSIDIDVFEKGMKEIYRQCGTISPKKDVNLFLKMTEILKDCTCLHINYESKFEHLPDGKIKKRSTPLIKTIIFTSNHMNLLNSTLLADNFIKQVTSIIAISKNLDKIKIINDQGQETIKLDEVQSESFKELINDFDQFLARMKKQGIDLLKVATTKTPMLAIHESQAKNAVPRKEDFEMGIAVHRIMLRQEYKYTKFKSLADIMLTMPGTLEECKDSAELDMLLSFIYNEKIYKSAADFLEACYNNMNMDHVYREFLLTELVTLLENMEENKLNDQVGNSEIISQIASEIYEIPKNKLTQKQKTSVVETIRNSIIHANYILGANDKFEIYDQKSAKEKQIEHKFTVYTDELEQIKDVCIKVFEDFGKKLNKKETKSPEKDAPIK